MIVFFSSIKIEGEGCNIFENLQGGGAVEQKWLGTAGRDVYNVGLLLCTLDRSVFGGHVRNDGRRDHAKRLEQCGFGVRHVRFVVQADRTATAGDPFGLVPDGLGRGRVRGQYGQREHDQVADGRVAADEVLELEHDVVHA